MEDHLAVFIAAWEQEKTPKQIPPDWIGQNPEFAGVVYMQTLWKLLCLWRSESSANPELANRAAYWCEEHEEIFQIIQHGMMKRVRSLWVERGQDGQPEFVTGDLISPENDFEMTAKTIAYIRFGDFLTGEPERMGFCAHCEKPFLKRAQKRKYCSGKCAHRGATESSRLQKLGMCERKRLKKAAKFLNSWLSKKSHRAKSIWSKRLQESTCRDDKYGFQTKDGRRNRTLGEYIRAAKTAPESPERARLFAKLSAGLGNAAECEALQRELDDFLANIKKVENSGKPGRV